MPMIMKLFGILAPFLAWLHSLGACSQTTLASLHHLGAINEIQFLACLRIIFLRANNTKIRVTV